MGIERAAEIVRSCSRPGDQFEWYPVSRELNDARHDGPTLIRPVESPSELY